MGECLGQERVETIELAVVGYAGDYGLMRKGEDPIQRTHLTYSMMYRVPIEQLMHHVRFGRGSADHGAGWLTEYNHNMEKFTFVINPMPDGSQIRREKSLLISPKMFSLMMVVRDDGEMDRICRTGYD